MRKSRLSSAVIRQTGAQPTSSNDEVCFGAGWPAATLGRHGFVKYAYRAGDPRMDIRKVGSPSGFLVSEYSYLFLLLPVVPTCPAAYGRYYASIEP